VRESIVSETEHTDRASCYGPSFRGKRTEKGRKRRMGKKFFTRAVKMASLLCLIAGKGANFFTDNLIEEVLCNTMQCVRVSNECFKSVIQKCYFRAQLSSPPGGPGAARTQCKLYARES
jgi:hypothetical protein